MRAPVSRQPRMFQGSYLAHLLRPAGRQENQTGGTHDVKLEEVSEARGAVDAHQNAKASFTVVLKPTARRSERVLGLSLAGRYRG